MIDDSISRLITWLRHQAKAQTKKVAKGFSFLLENKETKTGKDILMHVVL